jgi:hypothetical protein
MYQVATRVASSLISSPSIPHFRSHSLILVSSYHTATTNFPPTPLSSPPTYPLSQPPSPLFSRHPFPVLSPLYNLVAIRNYKPPSPNTDNNNNDKNKNNSKKKKKKYPEKRKHAHLKNKQHLHVNARIKRVLSTCDFWWGDNNLSTDNWLKRHLRSHDGWLPLTSLLQMPSFAHWVDEELLVQAFSSPDGKNRYKLDSSMVRHLKKGSLAQIDALDAAAAASSESSGDAAAPAASNIKVIPSRLLPHYCHDREVLVVKTLLELDDACDQLLQSAGKSHPALGFDVEYCRTEDDNRPNLPAMVQLASPVLAALVWLEHLPNQGRDVLTESPKFAALLSDEDVLKLGVGVDYDAVQLAAWFGVKKKSDAVKGMLDLSTTVAGESKGLAAECERELKMTLPKMKGERGERALKKKEYSYWRRTELTEQMRLYAANDAAVALDIWGARERKLLEDEYGWIDET